MGDPPRTSDTKEDTGVGTDRGAAGGIRSRWSMLGVILMIAIAIAVVVLIVLLHLMGTIGPGVH